MLQILSQDAHLIQPSDEAVTRASLYFLSQTGVPFEFQRTRNADACSPDRLLPVTCYNGQLLTGFDALCNALEAMRPKAAPHSGDSMEGDRASRSSRRIYLVWLSDLLRNVMLYFTWHHENTFQEFTRVRYTLALPWPLSEFVMYKEKRCYQKYLNAIGWDRKNMNDVLETVESVCFGLTELLRNGPFLFGCTSIGRLDALVCGYFSVFLDFDSVFHSVNITLKKYTKLMDLFYRIKERCDIAQKPV
ncbi:Metaxin-2 [Fasciolopsis buskii]|uniref:Metaxin-2 n=1 Tax=Fasciolopsis buskii TaxID=27845 RepID=A0A8E0VHM6_9TREM|nr:Metaxin-2 [Fasciolopsis buski]